MSSTLVSPKNWAAGVDYTTAANLNINRDAIQQLQGATPTGGQGRVDFFRAVQQTAQTGLATGYNDITFALADEILDYAGGHSGLSANYTVQVDGVVEIGGKVSFAGNTGRFFARATLSGNPIVGSESSQAAMSSGTTSVCLPPGLYVPVTAGQVITLQGYHDVASWATSVATGEGSSALSVKWVSVYP